MSIIENKSLDTRVMELQRDVFGIINNAQLPASIIILVLENTKLMAEKSLMLTPIQNEEVKSE